MNAKTPRRQGKKRRKRGRGFRFERGVGVPYEDEEPPYVEPDPELDRLAHDVIGAAIEVHRSISRLSCEGRGILRWAQMTQCHSRSS